MDHCSMRCNSEVLDVKPCRPYIHAPLDLHQPHIKCPLVMTCQGVTVQPVLTVCSILSWPFSFVRDQSHRSSTVICGGSTSHWLSIAIIALLQGTSTTASTEGSMMARRAFGTENGLLGPGYAFLHAHTLHSPLNT